MLQAVSVSCSRTLKHSVSSCVGVSEIMIKLQREVYCVWVIVLFYNMWQSLSSTFLAGCTKHLSVQIMGRNDRITNFQFSFVDMETYRQKHSYRNTLWCHRWHSESLKHQETTLAFSRTQQYPINLIKSKLIWNEIDLNPLNLDFYLDSHHSEKPST